MHSTLSRKAALSLFSVVVLTWGLNWVVTKYIVQSVPPVWTTAIRSGIACVIVLVIQIVRRDLIIPRLGDVPVILAIALLHMVAFSTLVAQGLLHVSVGRSIVLGYTTPLWVIPFAWLLLGERLSLRGLLGVASGLAGLLFLLNPLSFDWSDREVLRGHALILLASWCWAASILYVRRHRWLATPFQLIFWQTLLAVSVSSIVAVRLEGWPMVDWSPRLVAAFGFAGGLGTALGYWAMAMINRALPATTTALGMLATPVTGIVCSMLFLGERPDPMLLSGMALILTGIALGTVKTRAATPRAP